VCAALPVVHGGSSNEQGSFTEGMGHVVRLRCRALLGGRRHWTDQHAQESIHGHSALYVATAPFTDLLPHKSTAVCVTHLSVVFLADRTNGRAYATVLCPSVVCNVCIEAKRCVLPKKTLKKQIGNDLWRIEWSRDQWSHVSLTGQDHDPNAVHVHFILFEIFLSILTYFFLILLLIFA